MPKKHPEHRCPRYDCLKESDTAIAEQFPRVILQNVFGNCV
ncbi:MAG: hypothetical protein ACK6A9_06910 [Dolichospermum sp.]|jgi:hypothetical protein|nr:hypothetical protein [Dolichospermum sp. FACHB-1091]MCX5934378.1 hypothetical protein [Pseudanabaena sp. LacPavin_0818_WC45_MAG_42_6]